MYIRTLQFIANRNGSGWLNPNFPGVSLYVITGEVGRSDQPCSTGGVYSPLESSGIFSKLPTAKEVLLVYAGLEILFSQLPGVEREEGKSKSPILYAQPSMLYMLLT